MARVSFAVPLVALLALTGCSGAFSRSILTATPDGKGQQQCTAYPVTVTAKADTGQTHSTVVQVQDCAPGRNGK